MQGARGLCWTAAKALLDGRAGAPCSTQPQPATGHNPSALSGTWQNEPVHSAADPASPTRYTCTTLAPASTTATTATTTPTHGGAPPDRRAIIVGTPQASSAAMNRPMENQIIVEPRSACVVISGVLCTRANNHCPA